MQIYRHNSIILGSLPALALLASSFAAATGEGLKHEFHADDFWFDTLGTSVDVVAPFEFQSAQIRIRQRGKTEVWSATFGPGVSFTADLAQIAENNLADARYTYEVQFTIREGTGTEVDEGLETSQPETFSTSGTFNVQGGEIANVGVPGQQADQASYQPHVDSARMESLAGTRDISDSGDLAMGGYGIFGSDNLNDVIPGKLRILPTGSGSSAYANLTVQAFAANNDSYIYHFGTQAGDLGIQRQRTPSGPKVTVIGVEEDAREHALMITDNGNIGVGTATPANRMHIVGSGSGSLNPRIRFENTTHDQVWLSGAWSSDNFVIRNETSNRTVLWMDTSAQANSIVARDAGVGINTNSPNAPLDVSGDARFRNRVGIGTATPEAPLHIVRADNTAEIRLEDTGPGFRTMFRLVNDGDTNFRMENTSGQTWQFTNTTNAFVITRSGSPGPEMFIRNNGNMEIRGTLTENSSRTVKHGIQEIDSAQLLERLNHLAITEWRYDSDPRSVHVGPMAEDWHETFGLGAHDKGIAPRDMAGIALAAAQALNREKQSLARENVELKERLDRLENLINDRL